MTLRRNWLVRLRPRSDTLLTSQGRTVLATARNGFISEDSQYGLFVREARLLSSYSYLIDGKQPLPVALSNIEQHSLARLLHSPAAGILLPPDFDSGPPDRGSGRVPQAASQHSLELRLSRYIGEGVHEDVDLTNFTQQPTAFELELLADSDFASIEEITSTDGCTIPRQ
jgi:hypothetical protein